jgi:hypothetical protein
MIQYRIEYSPEKVGPNYDGKVTRERIGPIYDRKLSREKLSQCMIENSPEKVDPNYDGKVTREKVGPIYDRKLTREDGERVDPDRRHRVAVGGDDEHLVAVDGELYGAHCAEAPYNTKPVPHARLHVYLRVRRDSRLSSNLQFTQ